MAKNSGGRDWPKILLAGLAAGLAAYAAVMSDGVTAQEWVTVVLAFISGALGVMAFLLNRTTMVQQEQADKVKERPEE